MEFHEYRSGRYPGFTCFEYVMAAEDCLEGIYVLSESGARPRFFVGGLGLTLRLVQFMFDFKNHVMKIVS